jgi:hypothetical protein
MGATMFEKFNMIEREVLASLLAPIMRLTGFRFSKHYRWETTRFHAFVYRHVSTIKANTLADGGHWPKLF